MKESPSNADPLITLLTDFGVRDPFVGIVKGVIAGICPAARVIDLTHEVAPQDVRQGGRSWRQAVPYFPSGTIHVAVVDPGVGSERRIVAARTREATFVAPDNGLLGHVVGAGELLEAVSVENRDLFLKPVSSTFHGRDVFAPTAAHLACGTPLAKLGPAIDDLELTPPSRARRVDVDAAIGAYRVEGRVVAFDRFGNAMTDVEAAQLGTVDRVEVAGRKLEGLHSHYAAVPPGEPLALIGSSGILEISVREGNARHDLDLRVGTPVSVTARER